MRHLIAVEGFDLAPHSDFPDVYAAIIGAQPFSISSPQWWKQLQEISLKRHVDHPEIKEEETEGVRIGSPGDFIFIKDLRIDNQRREINVSGYERSGTGLIRPLKVQTYQDVIEQLENTGEDPLEFLNRCLKEIRALAKRISDNIG